MWQLFLGLDPAVGKCSAPYGRCAGLCLATRSASDLAATTPAPCAAPVLRPGGAGYLRTVIYRFGASACPLPAGNRPAAGVAAGAGGPERTLAVGNDPAAGGRIHI